MTLLDAPHYDPRRDRRRRIKIVSAIVLVLVIAAVLWMNRYWPQERLAGKFFAALANKDYEAAYGLYFADPRWKEHAEKHSQYPFNEFYRDWGPGGEWGIIKTYKVYGSSNCPGGGSGVVVDTIVNDRAQHAQLYVDKTDKTLSPPPCELQFR
jgi:hypothetical protein